MILDLGKVVATQEATRHIDHNYMMMALSCHGIGLGRTDGKRAKSSNYEWNGTEFLIVTEDEMTHVVLIQEG